VAGPSTSGWQKRFPRAGESATLASWDGIAGSITDLEGEARTMAVLDEESIYVLAPADHPDWPGEVLKVPAARKSDWLKGTRYTDVSSDPEMVAKAVDIRDRQGLKDLDEL
jgi:hypothetical protein